MPQESITTETAFFLLSPDGKILDANYVATKMYGYSPDEFLSMNAVELRIPEERAKFVKVMRDCFDKSCIVLTMHQRKDGSTFPVEIDLNGITIQGERGVASTIRDITERKRIEEEREQVLALLQEANYELQAILDVSAAASTLNFDELVNLAIGRVVDVLHADSGVILLREKNDILRAYSAVGLEVEEVEAGFTIPIGIGFAGTITSSGKPVYIRDAQTDSLVKNQIFRRESIRSMLGVPMWNRGMVIGVMHVEWLTLHDYDERELHILQVSAERCSNAIVNARLHQRTQELQHLSELFLDLMSHDINNMNQIGMGFLEMACKKIGSGKTIGKEDIELIHKAYEALQNSSTLIRNVRKIHQLRAGKLPLFNIDLCDIIADIQRHYSHSGAKTVTINFEPIHGCYVIANELLHDVFANIIGNAVKHSPDTYNLIIDIAIADICEDSRNYYLVTVSDNGPGIPDKRKEKLFDRFQNEEAPARGTGLGLYLVKTLVESFNGQIWGEDRVQGDSTRGAKFLVKLPSAVVC